MVSDEQVHAAESADSAEDAELVQRALAGAGDAVAALTDRLTAVIQARAGGLLYKHRRRAPASVSPRQELEDLVQEIFLELFRDSGRVLRQWDADKGLSLDGFVRLVTSRRTLSFLQKRSAQRRGGGAGVLPLDAGPVELEAPSAGAERILVARERLLRVLACLRSRLNPYGWRMFELFYVEELDLGEIRRREALSDAAIYQWRSRLRKAARDCRDEEPGSRGGADAYR